MQTQPINLTPAQIRQAIVDLLSTREWFKNSDEATREHLLGLPDSWNGALADLADRSDDIFGGVIPVSMEFPGGNFSGTPVFRVYNPITGKYSTYEYVTWNKGPKSGYKGLVIIVGANGTPTHFIERKAEKFATHRTEYDCVGGFSEGNTTFLDNVLREMAEELNVDVHLLKVREVIDLGEFVPDAGMTNNRPGLFLALITAETKIGTGHNRDEYELSATNSVRPIHEFPAHYKANRDGYSAGAIVQAIVQGYLPASILSPQA